MALGGKKNGGRDMVLESRHLVGLFMLMVVISAILFTLGYELGRSQNAREFRGAAGTGAATKENSRAAAESAPSKSAPGSAGESAGSVVPAPSDWDFYRAAEPNKSDTLQKLPRPAGATSKPSVPAHSASRPMSARKPSLLNAPFVPKGAIILQVAALTKEGEALALAEALQKKKFPAFVLTPGADQYYRVQVGPYADVQSANGARRGLENEGFKAIVRR